MKKMMMVDLETLGTKPGCAVLSIGAVVFDRAGTVYEQFRRHVYPRGEIDFETVCWWMRKSEKARENAFFPGQRVAIAIALAELVRFFKDGPEKVEVWANSPTFDLAILRHEFSENVYQDPPWKYWQERDVRTELRNEPRRKDEAEHDALEDCLAQVEMLAAKWNREDAGKLPLVQHACGE